MECKCELDRCISHRHFATDSLFPSIVHNTNDLFVLTNRNTFVGKSLLVSFDSTILISMYNDLVIYILCI